MASVLRPTGHPLNTNCVAWLNAIPPFQGGAMVELMGGYDGVLTGGAAWDLCVPATGSRGVVFGAGAYVNLAGAGTRMTGATAATLSAWVLPNGAGGNSAGRFFDSALNTQLMLWWAGNTSSINFVVAGSSSSTFNLGSALSGWRHVCCTWVSGSVPTIYIDGIAVTTGNATVTGTVGSLDDLILGDYNGGDRQFGGTMADARWYFNRALTAADVWALYQDSLQGYRLTIEQYRRRSIVALQPPPLINFHLIQPPFCPTQYAE